MGTYVKLSIFLIILDFKVNGNMFRKGDNFRSEVNGDICRVERGRTFYILSNRQHIYKCERSEGKN